MFNATFVAHLLACGGLEAPRETASSAQLPPEETGLFLGDTGFVVFPVDDTAASAVGDRDPAHTITALQEGTWSLAPASGPYTTMTGTLTVRERVDGDFSAPEDTAPPDTATPPDPCSLTFGLSGDVVEPGCAGCLVTLAVTHTLVEGDVSGCRAPDVPADGSVWVLGYHPGSAAILLDYGGTGVWLPWYAADHDGDVVTMTWTTTAGVVVPEEDS